jgi:hypothetical protein
MARGSQQKTYADFRQGFVTVANPLAYPEGSVKDIDNFDIEDNGTIKLRPGLKKNSTSVPVPYNTLGSLNDAATSVHIWDNVANLGDEKIAVIQFGKYLYFYPMLDAGIDLTDRLAEFVLDIPDNEKAIDISTASGGGWFFVAHPSIKPRVYFKRNAVVSFQEVDIRIRDSSVWQGVDDTATGLLKSGTMTAEHQYNLRNSGWPASAICSTAANADTGTTTTDPILHTKSKIGVYPTIGTPFYAGKAGGGDTLEKQNAYNPWGIENDFFGNTIGAKGKFIVNAESWSRTGTADPEVTTKTDTFAWEEYPTSVEFYAGRVWYSGAKGYSVDKDIASTLYFSQQLEDNLNKVGKCYQENDPTGEDINQLLSTDGGTIAIRGVGEIIDMQTFGTSLIVFANQGVWAISGTDLNSFKATDSSVKKLSNIGPVSKNTLSATNNSIYYIANDAIYILTSDDITGEPSPKDITSSRIKGFYNEIPLANKRKSKALFDTASRNLIVLYSNSESPELATDNISYNKALVFNQDLGCFYKYSININPNYVVDGVFYNKDQTITLINQIVSGNDDVVSNTDSVVYSKVYSTAAFNNIQFLTITDTAGVPDFSFSAFSEVEERSDWGNAFKGYVEFGFDAAGDILRDSLSTPVVVTHMEKTETGFNISPEDPDEQELILVSPSSCLLSYGWDWSTNYINPQQVYRFNRNYIPQDVADPFAYGVDIITTRNRIRGKGTSLGIRLDSEEGKDCRVLGIGILYTQAKGI